LRLKSNSKTKLYSMIWLVIDRSSQLALYNYNISHSKLKILYLLAVKLEI